MKDRIEALPWGSVTAKLSTVIISCSAAGGASGGEVAEFSAKLADFSRGSLQLLAIEE